MTVTINSNIASLNAQRQLRFSTGKLRESFERLSSGLRINHASDDAAGLSIATSLRTDSRIFTQGIRNVNDAISLSSIAEGAARELSNVIIRTQELAEQAANGTLSTTQRRALDSEAQALRNEYNRIVRTTSFSGMGLLDGTTTSVRVEAGGNFVDLSLSGIGTMAGDGTFVAAVSYLPGGNNYRDVVTGDFNGDGRDDVVAVAYQSDRVEILLGNADGSLGAPLAIGATGARVAKVIDVNNDGNLDILVGRDNNLSVILGCGNGSFKTLVDYAAGGQNDSLAIGDVNGDGRIDVVVGDASSGARVLLGAGGGAFTTGVAIADPNVVAVNLADMNGDGKLDYISTNSTNSKIFLGFGNGDGTFRAATSLGGSTGTYGQLVADFNNDGFLDIAGADGANSVDIELGNGNGTFRHTWYQGATTTRDLEAADFNSDGILDLATGSTSGTGQINLYFGNSNGSFSAPISKSVSSNSHSVGSGDINGDGVIDLVSGSYTSNRVNVLLGNGNPGLGGFSLLTKSSALSALTFLRQNHRRLTAALGQMGASQSRLQTMVSNLTQARENYETAATGILDADISVETAQLAKTQIQQQAAAAILAQANQLPALALRFLGR